MLCWGKTRHALNRIGGFFVGGFLASA